MENNIERQPLVVVNDIHKSYTKDTETLKGISFEVYGGEIFGLLGPNGAGKTTLMQIIATLLSPTSGSYKICDLFPLTDLLEIHRKIGFLTTEIKLDPQSTPDKLYDFFALLYDIPMKDIPELKEKAFYEFGIVPFRSKKIKELSTGMKQKISIAISLIHNPPVIIFDEPTNGLDILTQRQVMDYLIKLKNEGHAIILSTHIFSVVEQLCDRIAVMVDGNIVSLGSSEEIIKETNSKNFEEAFFNLYKDNHKGM